MSTPQRGLAILALVAVVSACIPGDATTEGTQVNALYVQFMVAAAVVFGIVYGLLMFAILRFRRRDDGLPDQVRGNRREDPPLEFRVHWHPTSVWGALHTPSAQPGMAK